MAAFVVSAATLSASHVLPLEGLALLFGVDRIVNIRRAAVNLIGNALATLITARLDGSFNQVQGVETYRAYFGQPALARV